MMMILMKKLFSAAIKKEIKKINMQLKLLIAQDKKLSRVIHKIR
jgi:hypothetical protein